MKTNQMDAMAGTAVNRGRLGWAVDWPSGYTSAMPNEATAKACAAAPDILAACEAAAAESMLLMPYLDGDFKASQQSLLATLRIAIRKARENL